MKPPSTSCIAGLRKLIALCSALILIHFLTAVLLPTQGFSQTGVGTGVVPCIDPQGGCAIDGDLLARIPTSPAPFTDAVGDLLENESAPGTGGGVFTNPDGYPMDPVTAYHIIDGYSNQGTKADVNIFTQGSKFNDNPNLWHWANSTPPKKDDMNNALFHFTSDANGHTWFIGGGDRRAVNGTSYIDFELLQHSLYMNANGTFTSSGPDGGRTVGDLVLTIEYSNGGDNAKMYCYRWTDMGGGSFSYQMFTPPTGTVYAASNINGPVSVPFGAFGSTTYLQYAYAEAACDLTELIQGYSNCMGIVTVVIKTKSSTALTAELKDLMMPQQLNLGTNPVVVVNSEEICIGGSATLTAHVTFPPYGSFTYLWEPGGSTDASITVSPTETTIYSCVVTNQFGCESEPAKGTVTVHPLPLCKIFGLHEVCPLSYNDYTGPDNMQSWSWDISGDGEIIGADDEQLVTVLAGECGGSYSLTLDITDLNGCISDCYQEYTIGDKVPPELVDLPEGQYIGCNPEEEELPQCDPGVTATDNCAVDPQVSCTPGPVIVKGCYRSQDFTYSAVDDCDNPVSATVTYTWKVDLIPPDFAGLPEGGNLGCNPEVLPSCYPGVTAADDCDGPVEVMCSAGLVFSFDCYRSQIITYTAFDVCQNEATAEVTYYWKVDLTPPEFVNLPLDEFIGTNPDPLPTCNEAVSAEDACDGTMAVWCTPGEIIADKCLRSQTFTYYTEDICGNGNYGYVIYTWKADILPPEFKDLPEDEYLGCNPEELPTCDDAVWALDECDGIMDVWCTPGETTSDDCMRSQTFTYFTEDLTGNENTAEVTYSWKVDITPPELSGVPNDEDLGCNPDYPVCDPEVTAADDCDGAVAVWCTAGEILISGENYSQIFTYYAIDDCDNLAEDGVVYTWTENHNPPLIENVPEGGELACNSPGPPISNAVEAYDSDGNPLQVTVDFGPISQDICFVTQTVIYTAVDDCGNTVQAFSTYSWKVDGMPPALEGMPEDQYIECGEVVDIPYPTGTDGCGGDVTVYFERSDGGAWDDPYPMGQTTTVCFWAVDECLNSSEEQCIELTTEQCAEEFCTVTQGFYGGDGGDFCDGTGTAALIESLLEPEDLVVGDEDDYMSFTYGDSPCIIALLPGGGPANTITGVNTCADHPGIQIELGRIHNNLLAQTITLGLNLRLSNGLGNVMMNSDTLLIAESTGCGEEGDEPYGEWTKYVIPQSVYLVLSQNWTIVPTVYDLYLLANVGLGDGDVGETNLTDLANAEEKINNGFDQCRFGLFQFALPTDNLQKPSGDQQPGGIADINHVRLNIYPNPFKTVTNINFSLPKSGHVTVDIYSLSGDRILRVFDKFAEAGIEYKAEFSGQTGAYQATYICVITTDYGTKYQRIMMMK